MKPASGKQLCEALERKGWYKVRIRGAHHIYYKTGAPRTIPVPVHGNQTLPPGTQRGIMRQAGLTDADL